MSRDCRIVPSALRKISCEESIFGPPSGRAKFGGSMSYEHPGQCALTKASVNSESRHSSNAPSMPLAAV